MEVCFYIRSTAVASVDKIVLALVVQFKQHGHRRVLCAAQRRELVVFLARHHEECVTTVHQIVGDERVRVFDGRQPGRNFLQRSKPHYEKHLTAGNTENIEKKTR